jgi:hypothetical protein
MKTINEYKNRFNQLLESTMGNVKPLISEQLTGTTGTDTSIFDECFTTQNIPLDKLPQSCKDMINNKDEVNSFYGRSGVFYFPLYLSLYENHYHRRTIWSFGYKPFGSSAWKYYNQNC